MEISVLFGHCAILDNEQGPPVLFLSPPDPLNIADFHYAKENKVPSSVLRIEVRPIGYAPLSFFVIFLDRIGNYQ